MIDLDERLEAVGRLQAEMPKDEFKLFIEGIGDEIEVLRQEIDPRSLQALLTTEAPGQD